MVVYCILASRWDVECMISNGGRVFLSRGDMKRLIVDVPRSSRGTVNDVVRCEYRMCCEIILCEGFEHIVACWLVVRSVRTFFWKTCECRLGSARGIDDILIGILFVQKTGTSAWIALVSGEVGPYELNSKYTTAWVRSIAEEWRSSLMIGGWFNEYDLHVERYFLTSKLDLDIPEDGEGAIVGADGAVWCISVGLL